MSIENKIISINGGMGKLDVRGNMSYKILSIDGGGIKGVYALQVLNMLQEEVDRDILKKFDCYAGTSTGALIVSAIAMGFEVKDLIRFYTLFGKRVFPKRREGENHAKYANHRLKQIMKRIFPHEPTLFDIEKDIIIPTCRLSSEEGVSWSPQVYDNFDRELAKETSLIDVSLRSAAAPIYFPSYQNYIDGGIFAINPSLVAFSRAIDINGANKDINDIRLLSIGNGINPANINEEIDWDEKQWMQPYGMVANHPLYSLMTDMGSLVPDYPLTQLLKGRYHRINGMLPESIEMDDVEKIGLLNKSARSLRTTDKSKWSEIVDWTRENVVI